MLFLFPLAAHEGAWTHKIPKEGFCSSLCWQPVLPYWQHLTPPDSSLIQIGGEVKHEWRWGGWRRVATMKGSKLEQYAKHHVKVVPVCRVMGARPLSLGFAQSRSRCWWTTMGIHWTSKVVHQQREHAFLTDRYDFLYITKQFIWMRWLNSLCDMHSQMVFYTFSIKLNTWITEEQ